MLKLSYLLGLFGGILVLSSLLFKIGAAGLIGFLLIFISVMIFGYNEP